MNLVVTPVKTWLFDRASQMAAVIAVAWGVVVLIGWLSNMPAMMSVIPGLTAMKVNTALGFILSGASLWRGQRNARRHVSRSASQISACLVAILGLLSLGEYLTGADFGIDQMVMRDPTTLPGDIPGRMAVSTAISFSALGASLLLLNLAPERLVAAVHMFAIVPILAAGSALIGYAYHVDEFIRVKINYTPMALNTAVVFVLLVIGVVNAHPGFPLRRLGVSNSAAGVAVRRLLPAAIGFTFVAGWLIHVAVAHAAYFSEPVGLALFAAVSMSGLSALILWSAGVFDEADADRNRIYAEVLRLNAELEERVEVRTAELRRASAYMRSLIEASLDPLVTISAEGKITDVNSAAVRATGAPRESLLGSDFSAYFTEPDQAHAGYQAVFAKGEVRDYPLALQHASGKVIEVLFNASVFRNEWGEAEGVFAAARDITDLKRGAEALRKRTEELDSFFNLSLDMLCIANTGGYFTRLNPAWECTLGYAIAELMQRPFYDFVHPEDLASTREVVAGLASQKELVNFGNRYRCKDGSYRWFEWNASAVGERIYASARDITERKLAEKALHRLNRELRAISNCNQALMRADDEQTLLNDVCRVICEEADDRMLWVGYAENADGRTIHPVAWAGFDSGHLSDAKPTWAKGVERGQGPAGKTIQSGETVYVHDFTADPQMTPWRQSALARGYRSGIALPLKGESARAFGALVMYSSDINGINPDEIRLLEELARALSFGIIALRTRIKRNQAENIMQARLRLMEFSSSHTMDELLSAALDEIESLTGSNIGFYHFVEPDQKTLSLQSWSSNTLKGVCTAEGKGFHYDVAEAGVWADCLRERRPIIHNDYASLPHRKGMPEGHAPVIREVVVPIFRGDQIRAVIGVGNKPTNYNDGDIEIASQLGDLSWDITEHKRAEKEIVNLNHELQKRLAALEQSKNELESFSYSVSHDLKIPLRAIDGFTYILLEEYKDQLEGEAGRYLDVVRGNVLRMARLIDGLLDFISLSQRDMRMAPVDMGALALQVFEELWAMEPERDISLCMSNLPPAYGDRVMIRQVLVNLLGNAIKFTSPRPKALIEIGGAPTDKENTYFVRDNGVGFDMRYIEKLFGVFLRLHSPEEFAGAGVGLAIVKRIISRHGCGVWAESELGEGATFYFTLPRIEPGRIEPGN